MVHSTGSRVSPWTQDGVNQDGMLQILESLWVKNGSKGKIEETQKFGSKTMDGLILRGIGEILRGTHTLLDFLPTSPCIRV